MPFPSKYSQEFKDAAVAMVRQRRAAEPNGAIAAIARDLQLDPKLVQAWVAKAERPAPANPLGDSTPRQLNRSDGDLAVLAPGLLCCRICRRRMVGVHRADGTDVYTCRPGCRRRTPVDAARVIDAIGHALLRNAPKAVLGGAPSPRTAAAQAGSFLHRVLVGTRPTDLSLTWRTTPPAPPANQAPAVPLADVVAQAHAFVADGNLTAAHTLLRDQIHPINTAHGGGDAAQADAALLYAEILLRLGKPAPAARWAAIAHRRHQHLNGDKAEATIAAAHLLAAAHRHAGDLDTAYYLYRALAAQLVDLEGRTSHRALAATANLAVVLHARGHCAEARTLLAETITVHHRAHPRHRAGVRMLVQLAAMYADCGDPQRERDTRTTAHKLAAELGHPDFHTTLNHPALQERHTCEPSRRDDIDENNRTRRRVKTEAPSAPAVSSAC